MESWFTAVTNAGMGVVVIVAVGVFIWKVTVAIGKEIIIPIRDRMLTRIERFFDRLEKTLESMSSSIDRLSEGIEKQARTCESHVGSLNGLGTQFARLETKLERKQPEDK